MNINSFVEICKPDLQSAKKCSEWKDGGYCTGSWESAYYMKTNCYTTCRGCQGKENPSKSSTSLFLHFRSLTVRERSGKGWLSTLQLMCALHEPRTPRNFKLAPSLFVACFKAYLMHALRHFAFSKKTFLFIKSSHKFNIVKL